MAAAAASSAILFFPVSSKPLGGVRGVPFFRGLVRSRTTPFLAILAQIKVNLCRPRCLYTPKDATNNMLSSQGQIEDDVDDEACELVSGAEITLGEDEDAIDAYVLKAVKNNNGAGVLFLSDIFGFEDSATREFAYRVACSGYNVLVPDLFRGNPWKKGQDRSMLDNWLTKQPAERVARDIATSATWLINEFVAAGMSKKLGVIGFCFGGNHLIKTLAQDKQASFGTGVCFYGTNMDPSLASDIKVPVLFICGDNDPLCPVKTLQDMERKIEGSRIVMYPDRGHGFAHRPESQEEDEDAENAFSIARHWLHDCLVVKRGMVCD